MRNAVSFIVLVLAGVTAPSISSEGDQPIERVFDLEEASVYCSVGRVQDFLIGQRTPCSQEPDAGAKAYPKRASEKALYGTVQFAAERDAPDAGASFCFAFDESQGTGAGYDRLYFDANGDYDLTNDVPLTLQEKPPDGSLLGYSSLEQEVCFEVFSAKVGKGSDHERSLELFARLTVFDGGYSMASFVATKLRTGRIEIGGRPYDAFLGFTYSVGSTLDRPETALHLLPADSSEAQSPTWWGGDQLNALRNIDGTLYGFSATPTGAQLTTRPYTGDFGVFEVSPGDRNITKMAANGCLRSQEANVALGSEELEYGWPQKAQRCRLPVGDYIPTYLRIDYGRLSIFASDNYHADGGPRNRGERPPVHSIQIRKDKAFVLDFSNKPQVLFASPPREHRVKRGEKLEVKAVLIDPELDLMIRGLDDTTRTTTEENGRTKKFSLDPQVRITRADGELVVEGVMPFG